MEHVPSRDEDLDWKNRRLCVDGNCIGTIGPDGRCKECGKPYEEVPEDGKDPVPPPAEQETEIPETDTADPVPEAVLSDDEDDDWANRRLCPDGNCIGVIGPDGRCKECGRPAEEASNTPDEGEPK